MKFSSGCLLGLLLGIALSIIVVVGYVVFNSTDLLPLTPASSVSNPDLTVTIKEQYLNDQLRKGLAARGMDSSDMTVALHAPNRADATMTMSLTALGQTFKVRPQASFHFVLSNGMVSFELDKVAVSGLGIPQEIVNQQMGTLKSYAENQLNAELRQVLANSGLHIVGIEVTEGALIVKLSR
jgi:uncharacterized protein YpmS